MPYLLFLFLAITWGASFILMKKGVLWFSPMEVGAGRMLGGAAILILWGLLWPSRSTLRWKDCPTLIAMILLGAAWPYSVQPWLVPRDGSAFVAMTVSFTPLLTVLVSVPLLGRRPTVRQIVGVLFALMCLFVLMKEGMKQSISFTDMLLGISVPAGYAIANTLIRRNLGHASPREITMVSLFSAGLLVYGLRHVVEGPSPHQGDFGTALLAVLALGVVGTGLAMLAFNSLVQQQGPLFAGMVTNLVPLGAVLWGWADGESITPLQILALVGIVAAVMYVQTGAATQPVAVPAASKGD